MQFPVKTRVRATYPTLMCAPKQEVPEVSEVRETWIRDSGKDECVHTSAEAGLPILVGDGV